MRINRSRSLNRTVSGARSKPIPDSKVNCATIANGTAKIQTVGGRLYANINTAKTSSDNKNSTYFAPTIRRTHISRGIFTVRTSFASLRRARVESPIVALAHVHASIPESKYRI